MSQKAQRFFFVCRSCRHQLEHSSTSSSRSFSSSAKRPKTIPQFSPTTSPELDALLLDFRRNVFTPEALAKRYQSLIYKKTRQHVLTNDPGIKVTLSNDEEVHLEPLNKFERPNKSKGVKALIKLLSETTPEDGVAWGINVPSFLEGMVIAKENIDGYLLEKLTRKANETGNAGVMIRCAEMVKKTGYSLSVPEITRELVLGCHTRAAHSQFQGEGLEKALRQLDRIVLLMDDQLHCAGKFVAGDGKRDMRKDLNVLGTVLELHAANALNVQGGKDTNGKVLGYAKKLIALKGISGGAPTNVSPQVEERLAQDPLWKSNFVLQTALPVQNGVRLALKVESVGTSDVGESLRIYLKELDQVVANAEKQVRELSKGKSRRSLAMYDTLKG